MKKGFVGLISLILIPVFLISLSSTQASARAKYKFDPDSFQKGMCYVTWNANSYETKRSDESLQMMAGTGVTCVQIVVTWYQQDFNSIKMERVENRTPTDTSVIHAIQKAHEYGMAVMLKPHVDLIRQENSSRGDIGFSAESDWEEWFANYMEFIKYYARMAEKEGVEIFCIGTELSYASTKTDVWRNLIIPEVKNIFSGQLTYAANWDNYKNIKFWDELDYAGIDAYFPLSNKNNPTLEDLKEGWQKWLCEIEEWHGKVNKPIIFTEVGYCSADIAPNKPWEEAFSGNTNLRIQADCYRALLETFCGKSWFAGVYWWKWNIYAGSGGKNHKRFTPQNKPALDYVKMWYTQLIKDGGAF